MSVVLMGTKEMALMKEGMCVVCVVCSLAAVAVVWVMSFRRCDAFGRTTFLAMKVDKIAWLCLLDSEGRRGQEAQPEDVRPRRRADDGSQSRNDGF